MNTSEALLKIYKKFPKKFPSKQKAILIFEEIDGIDVLVFQMYVQYYGSECANPNKRSLYIAYLDSINFFKPKHLRTALYQELIESLLEYERARGYLKCFIWACPPSAGDDYIFNVHPRDQKVPDGEVLKNWYLVLLEHARRKGGSVVSVTTMYDEYFCKVPDMTYFPYFEGDWWQVYR